MPPFTVHFSVLKFEKHSVHFNSLQLHFKRFEGNGMLLLPDIYHIAVFFLYFKLYYVICTNNKYNFPEYYCSSSCDKSQIEVSFPVLLKVTPAASDFQ